MTSLPKSAWRSLYRKLVRNVLRLPDAQATTFFKQKIQTDFRKTTYPEVKHRRLLRHLEATNAGFQHALTRTLETAYGVRGKEARRAIEAILAESRSARGPPLKPGNPRTRLPSFTPRLAGFLISPAAHVQGKAPTLQQLDKPPSLPERADPSSEEARLLGPLNPRRHANISWRYLTSFRERLATPLAPDQVDRLVKLAAEGKAKTSAATNVHVEQHRDWNRPRKITNRLLRRRYREILDKSVEFSEQDAKDGTGQTRWAAYRPAVTRRLDRGTPATAEDLSWILAKGTARVIPPRWYEIGDIDGTRTLARYGMIAFLLAEGRL